MEVICCSHRCGVSLCLSILQIPRLNEQWIRLLELRYVYIVYGQSRSIGQFNSFAKKWNLQISSFSLKFSKSQPFLPLILIISIIFTPTIVVYSSISLYGIISMWKKILVIFFILGHRSRQHFVFKTRWILYINIISRLTKVRLEEEGFLRHSRPNNPNPRYVMPFRLHPNNPSSSSSYWRQPLYAC